MNVRPITVAQYGIGPIGAEIARLLLTKGSSVTPLTNSGPNTLGHRAYVWCRCLR